MLAHEVELNEARLRHSTALAHLEEKLALAQADARRSRLRTASSGLQAKIGAGARSVGDCGVQLCREGEAGSRGGGEAEEQARTPTPRPRTQAHAHWMRCGVVPLHCVGSSDRFGCLCSCLGGTRTATGMQPHPDIRQRQPAGTTLSHCGWCRWDDELQAGTRRIKAELDELQARHTIHRPSFVASERVA